MSISLTFGKNGKIFDISTERFERERERDRDEWFKVHVLVQGICSHSPPGIRVLILRI